MPTDWADLNKDGKRLEYIIRQMDTKQRKLLKKWQTEPMTKDELDMYFAFIDRIIKATNSKVNVVEIVLNIKKTLKEAQRQVGTAPLINT